MSFLLNIICCKSFFSPVAEIIMIIDVKSSIYNWGYVQEFIDRQKDVKYEIPKLNYIKLNVSEVVDSKLSLILLSYISFATVKRGIPWPIERSN